MSKKLYEESNIQDIANAIRDKNGLSDKYKVTEMAGAILAMESDHTDEDSLVTGTITEYSNDRVTTIRPYAFYSCKQLTTADFPNATIINPYTFDHCLTLTKLILRKNTVCTLSNTNALTNTPIASGTGYIYVPSALIDEYKAATNWVTYAAQFRALEDYTVDGTTTGELDESKVSA